jgi:hypothetical protein
VLLFPSVFHLWKMYGQNTLLVVERYRFRIDVVGHREVSFKTAANIFQLLRSLSPNDVFVHEFACDGYNGIINAHADILKFCVNGISIISFADHEAVIGGHRRSQTAASQKYTVELLPLNLIRFSEPALSA